MSQDHASVSEWMKDLVAGDKVVPVEKLWERYFPRLVHLARAYLSGLPRRVADEEDVALSAFDTFCQRAAKGQFPQLNDRNDLWRLLVTITVRKAHQLKLRNNRQKRGGGKVLDAAALAGQGQDSAELQLERIISEEPTPEFAAEAAEEYQRLLALLPGEELRSIAQLKMEGYTIDEIAARLGCVKRSVERRLRTIRICWETNDEQS